MRRPTNPCGLRGIDPDDFRRQLEAKGVVAGCPACGETGFTVPESALGTNVVGLPAMLGSQVVPGRALPVVPLVCNNCGFVRLHTASFGEVENAPDNGEGTH
jgi:hypothetical protein